MLPGSVVAPPSPALSLKGVRCVWKLSSGKMYHVLYKKMSVVTPLAVGKKKKLTEHKIKAGRDEGEEDYNL